MLAGAFNIDIVHLTLCMPNNLSLKGSSTVNQFLALAMLSMSDENFVNDSRKLATWVKNNRNEMTVAPVPFDTLQYNGIVFFYSNSLRDRRVIGTPLPARKIAVCINNEKWRTDGAEHTTENYFQEAKIIVACNQSIIDAFTPHHPRVLRVSQVVNPSVFKTDRKAIVRADRMGEKFVVGWSGNYHNPIKNVEQIRSACSDAGVKFLITKNRSRVDLNTWYNEKPDAVVCASSSEGGPMMLLEAGACSIPVITTPVGLAREIVVDGKSGLVIPHDEHDAMVSAIRALSEDLQLRASLAECLHREVTTNWTHEARIHEIQSVLTELCDNDGVVG